MKTSAHLFLLAAATSVLLSACSLLRGNTADSDSIETVEWQLADIGSGSGRLVPADTQRPTLLVVDGRASGSTGCNSYSGTARRDGSKLTFGSIAATRKFCLTGMDVEAALLKALAETDNFRIKDGRLLLRRGKTELATFSPSGGNVWLTE